MSNNLIGVQRPAQDVHHEKISVPDCQKKAVSRLREIDHTQYRCTRSYKTSSGKN